jgi:hypothetical protein
MSTVANPTRRMVDGSGTRKVYVACVYCSVGLMTGTLMMFTVTIPLPVSVGRFAMHGPAELKAVPHNEPLKENVLA